jgi:hypothetical protein
MKKLFLIIFLFSLLGANAQNYRSLNREHTNGYSNHYCEPSKPKVKIRILPILGAILTTAYANQYDSYDLDNLSTRQIMRQHYYQNQLELQRIELLQRQVEILERQKNMDRRYRRKF